MTTEKQCCSRVYLSAAGRQSALTRGWTPGRQMHYQTIRALEGTPREIVQRKKCFEEEEDSSKKEIILKGIVLIHPVVNQFMTPVTTQI